MRRMLAVAVGGMLLAAGAAVADEADFGFRAGYQQFGAEDDSGGLMGGAFFRKDWRRVVFFEGAILYRADEIGEGAGRVDVEFIPVQFTAQIFPLRRNHALAPYLQGGAGVYIVRTTAPGEDSESEYDFGWHLGLGVDWDFWENVFIEGDFRYIWLDTDVEGQTFADTLSDFNSWMATVGIGFRL